MFSSKLDFYNKTNMKRHYSEVRTPTFAIQPIWNVDISRRKHKSSKENQYETLAVGCPPCFDEGSVSTAFGREKSPILTMKRDMKRVLNQKRRKESAIGIHTSMSKLDFLIKTNMKH